MLPDGTQAVAVPLLGLTACRRGAIFLIYGLGGFHLRHLAFGVAAALGIVVAGCAGGAATPAATTPTKPAAITTPAAVTTPAGAATKPAATTGTTAGDANRGRALIASKGCTSCHVVPGVPEAKGTVGPNLAGFAARPQIAGTLPNNADNLVRWLKNPPGVKQGTAMPNLGLSDQEIADLSAFLSTLK